MTTESTTAADLSDVNPWLELLGDAETIAEDYADAGWDVTTVEPVDVTPVDDEERSGLAVLVSPAEYEAVEAAVDREEATFGAAEVYYRALEDLQLALAVEVDEESETAVFVPLYYEISSARGVLEAALEEGQLRIYVHPGSVDEGEADAASDGTSQPTSEDRWVVFFHDDPSLFVRETALE
ncbi:hypothetical protein ACFQGT_07565 [Natrialbaceae archaeon GCM10025810]|uniref:DUF7529 family protein n=1 Tax=Halovalidus salilacus TaxID=3075124 RepID=UPI003621BA4B